MSCYASKRELYVTRDSHSPNRHGINPRERNSCDTNSASSLAFPLPAHQARLYPSHHGFINLELSSTWFKRSKSAHSLLPCRAAVAVCLGGGTFLTNRNDGVDQILLQRAPCLDTLAFEQQGNRRLDAHQTCRTTGFHPHPATSLASLFE